MSDDLEDLQAWLDAADVRNLRRPRFYLAPTIETDSHWEFAKGAAYLGAVCSLFTVVALVGLVFVRGVGVASRAVEWVGELSQRLVVARCRRDEHGKLCAFGAHCFRLAARMRRKVGLNPGMALE